MIKAIQYRLNPNQKQVSLIEKHFGCSRFIYNWGLNKKIVLYQNEMKNITRFQLDKLLPQLKQENPWLKEVNAQTLQASLKNLDMAYTKFFRSKKEFPKFKSKHKDKNSFEIPSDTKISYENYTIKVPKIKGIKFFKDKQINGKICFSTIWKSSTNKYFISIVYDDGKQILLKQNIKNVIGIDLGITHFATLSNGEKIANPKFLKKKLKALARSQRNMSRKQKGSKNREKARLKLARVYEKVSNQRKDFLHKITHKLTHNEQVDTICLETLGVKDMMQKSYKSMARNIGDCSWSTFNNFLNYKSNWYGKNILRIGRYEPSSKMCTCGKINHKLTLKNRTWTCTVCGKIHDRDVLAANNIKSIALNRQNLIEEIGKGIPEFTLVETNDCLSWKQEPTVQSNEPSSI